ncbi:MAG: C_GCAxxG_C_C family protein [Deltaproteobacteria bacterium]|nr:C_GCAxxG_C_C family protein [Deltaproteobacteria bacterium]
MNDRKISKELNERMIILSRREWDLPAIEKRFKNLVENSIPKKRLDRQAILPNKAEILDRVQTRAEEYCYLNRSCAKGSTLALLEEFGLGNMDIIKAMAPFPGLAMTGGICGPVSGGLIAIGLFFSDEGLTDYRNPLPYIAARAFIERFEKAMGSLLCPKIQDQLLGGNYDPFAGPEELEAFDQSGAQEKCPVAPGLGARIAATIIIESLEKD